MINKSYFSYTHAHTELSHIQTRLHTHTHSPHIQSHIYTLTQSSHSHKQVYTHTLTTHTQSHIHTLTQSSHSHTHAPSSVTVARLTHILGLEASLPSPFSREGVIKWKISFGGLKWGYSAGKIKFSNESATPKCPHRIFTTVQRLDITTT